MAAAVPILYLVKSVPRLGEHNIEWERLGEQKIAQKISRAGGNSLVTTQWKSKTAQPLFVY